MNNLERNKNYNNQNFENIKHIDKNGIEFWFARELQFVLDYKEWRKFENVIKKAIDACKNSSISAFEHFVGTDKTIQMPKGATKSIKNYKLTRYSDTAVIYVATRKKFFNFIEEMKFISSFYISSIIFLYSFILNTFTFLFSLDISSIIFFVLSLDFKSTKVMLFILSSFP